MSSSNSDIISHESKIKPEETITLQNNTTSNDTDSVDEKGNEIISVVSPTHNHEIVKLDGTVDKAMELAAAADELILEPGEDKKLLRKIDLYMLPLFMLSYALQFEDKITISLNSILGLRQDLHMVGEQYANAASIFYYAYIAGLFIFPPLLQKSKQFILTFGLIVIIWGLILTVQGAPNVNYGAFLALRFLLGFFESAITPAYTIISCAWWKSSEIYLRLSLWFGCNGFGTIMGNSVALGLYKHDGSYSIATWRLLFIITGLSTIFLAFIIMLHVPNNPSKAWFLSEREKLMVVKRIKGNQQGYGNNVWKWKQFKEALIDVRTWLFFTYSITSQIPNGALTNFQSILIKEDFQFTTEKTLKMNLIGGMVSFVGVPLFAWIHEKLHARKVPILGDRLFMAIFANIICGVASCMLAFAKHNKYARLAGVFLTGLIPVAFVCIMSNVASNTLGYTKKWTANSIFLISYAASNIAGTHTFIAKQAPDYVGGKVAMVVCYWAGVVVLGILYYVNWSENKRRDQWALEHPEEAENVKDLSFYDLTDFENPHFRYAL
ncbi:hypothetical protein ACO0QE_002598 [Hanseniaspora vineae]